MGAPVVQILPVSSPETDLPSASNPWEILSWEDFRTDIWRKALLEIVAARESSEMTVALLFNCVLDKAGKTK